MIGEKAMTNADHTLLAGSLCPDIRECLRYGRKMYCSDGEPYLRMPKQDVFCLYRQIAILWDFIAESGLWGDAKEYMESQMDEEPPIPFSFLR